MHLKEELIKSIKENNPKQSGFIDRDIKLILEYFGFGDDLCPTYQSIADKYSTDRQRVEQIMSGKLMNKVKIQNLPSLLEINDHFNKKSVFFYSDLKELFDGANTQGVIKLLKKFNLLSEYKIFTIDLETARGEHYENYEEFLIIHKTQIDELKKTMKIVRTVPGQIGIAELHDVAKKNHFDNGHVEFSIIKNIVKKSLNSWFYETEEYGFLYMYQDRDNVLKHEVQKIRSITDNLDFYIMAEAIYNSIKKTRSSKYEKPTIDILRRYYSEAPYIVLNKNGRCYIKNIEPRELTDVEKDIVSYLESKEKVKYVELKNHLSSKGYSKPLIDKSCFNSSLVYLDKSAEGKGEATYSLITKQLRSTIGMNSENEFSYSHNKSPSLSDSLDDEIHESYPEGAKKTIIVNAYERNIKAREKCIKHHGYKCYICGFEFKDKYGETGEKFIIVHHIKPLNEIDKKYEVDPINDLIPVCANCHAMIHRKNPAFTIEEVKEMISTETLNTNI